MVKNMLPTGRLVCSGLLLLAAETAALGGACSGPPKTAEARAPVISDWRTGLALHGFDPVAYFSEAKALRGRPELERSVGGATWQFRNEGNQAAFLADCQVYQPRFAGYDPLSIARGVATAGNPLVWLVFDQRLYLFHDPAARAAFTADPRHAIAAAEERWPAITGTLLP
jgi:hypothetical protein